MFTTIYLIGMLPIVAGLFYLMAAVRVLRVNAINGVFMLLFAPFGLYALIRYWRDPEVGIRFPMVAALATLGIWLALGFHVVKQTDREIARLRAANQHVSSGASGGNALEQQMRLSVALSNLPLQNGRIDLTKAHASIDVPAHFRFIERSALESAYREFDDPLDATTVGWLVHESVNLADADSWYIEIDWHPDGYVAEGGLATLPAPALLSEAQSVAHRLVAQQGGSDDNYRIVRYAETPDMNADQHTTTWVEETADAERSEHRLDCYAAKLGRAGAFQYTISDIRKSRQELCLRSVRLAAARTAFANGQGYADHSRLFDHSASYDLAALVTGKNLLAE